MTRFVSALNQTEADKPSVTMCLMVDLHFVSGTLSLHDGVGTLVDSFSSPNVTYLGVGAFGSIDGAVQDSLEVIARPLKLGLTGVDSAIINEAMVVGYQGRPVTISIGFVNDGELIAAPQVVWEGKMDYMQLSFGEGSASISLNCEHRLRREPRIARYTQEDQQLAHPTDTFFHLVHVIPGFRSQWGSERTWYGGGNVTPQLYDSVRGWLLRGRP